jgi:hypothetical protein
MKLETLEEVKQRKQEIERKIEEETGEKEGPITRRIASSGLSEELKGEEELHSKLESAERYISEAKKIIESINTEEHRKLLEKYRDKGVYTGEKEYHDEEVEKANKISKALEHFLTTIKGNEEDEIFLNTTEDPEEDSLNRKKITSALLEASRKLSRARSILTTQDKPNITEQEYKELRKLAEDIEKERKEILNAAEKAENYLRAAQKNIEELED